MKDERKTKKQLIEEPEIKFVTALKTEGLELIEEIRG